MKPGELFLYKQINVNEVLTVKMESKLLSPLCNLTTETLLFVPPKTLTVALNNNHLPGN